MSHGEGNPEAKSLRQPPMKQRRAIVAERVGSLKVTPEDGRGKIYMPRDRERERDWEVPSHCIKGRRILDGVI